MSAASPSPGAQAGGPRHRPRFAVVRFPGSNCDQDAFFVIQDVLGCPVEYVWHQERSLRGFDVVILPGGFAYGDYLRTGAVARFAPIMEAVCAHADRGGPVLGLCNGFQILCEAGLLPGALVRNIGCKFLCKQVFLRVENCQTPFTNACGRGQVLQIPIAHGEGRFVCDEAIAQQLTAEDRIVFRYSDAAGNITAEENPNGSHDQIAGICSARFNVLGMMPHPERASEKILGSADGLAVFRSLQEIA